MLYKKSNYSYEIYFLIALIFISIILLFVFSRIEYKTIYQLNNESNGIFKIQGFVTNFKEYSNYNSFKLQDLDSSINVFDYTKSNYLNGEKIEIICKLKTTNYNKICTINK